MFSTEQKLQYFSYDTKRFDFESIFRTHLMDAIGSPNPEDLHQYIPANHMPAGPVEGTAQHYGHEILYAMDPAFKQAGHVPTRDFGFVTLYRDFMRHLQDDVIGEPIVFQRLPSLRIHYPGHTAGGIMHRDADFNHPTQEVNVWLPITRAQGTASMLIESDINKADYAPVELPYGGYIIFDSALMHGNTVNDAGYTRVSFDMRFIPRNRYKDHGGKFSMTAGRQFAIGDYYDTF